MEKIINLKSNKTTGISVQTLLLNTRNLTSGATYQRPINPLKIARIISNFNEHKINPIKVSFRDNKYWVYDGQHTLVVLKAMNNGEDCMVLCEVHFGLTYEDEARLFAEQNDDCTKVSAAYKMRALYESKNPEIIDIKNIVESEDFEMNFDNYKGDNKVIAVTKIRSIYRIIGHNGLKRVLNLVKQAWDGQSTSLDKNILGGMALFVKTYANDFNEDILIKNLKRIAPLDIKRNGNSDTSCKNNDLKYAKQIFEAYNYKLTKKNRLEYKFKG